MRVRRLRNLHLHLALAVVENALYPEAVRIAMVCTTAEGGLEETALRCKDDVHLALNTRGA